MPFQFCVTCLSVCVCGPEQGNDWGLDEIFRQFPFLDADPSNWPVNTIPIETEISPVSSAPPDALPYSPPSITSRDVLRRDDNQSDESFAYSCFPHPHQDGLRAHLVNVLQQSWLFLNQPEPTGAFRFLLQDAEPGKQRCSICSKIYRRGGRALEHIRIHLGHKPFACFGGYIGCSQPSCGKMFHGKESLKDHQRRDHVQCGQCHLVILRKNHGRHQRKSCPALK